MTEKTNEPIPLFFSIEAFFAKETALPLIPLRLINAAEFEEYNARASASFSRQIEQAGFNARERQICVIRDDQGAVVEVLIAITGPISLYFFSFVHEKLRTEFSDAFLRSVVFGIEYDATPDEANKLCAGWALAGYRFDALKKEKTKGTPPVLVWPKEADEKHVRALVESLCLIKTLINLPANRLGTNELADASSQIARQGRASFSRIAGKDLLEHNFPMIYEVGKGSVRPPQIVEINWGSEDHPRLTLVGKGVVFDTGGLDIKPPAFMQLMKKDMGGAAHALALGHYIMAMGYNLRLRILIAIAENSIGGESFRPGDVIGSRKGLSVEIGDTDAEGRLVVGDALAYACEGARPDLMIDFCTLTGSARAALGYDIPAFFANRESLLEPVRSCGMESEDPVWPLPLWQPYLKEMQSSVADINNVGSGKAGAIHGALFLHQFVDPNVDWIHFDCYAWEQSGKPGRPQGGADTGLRAALSYIKKRYAIG
jgi:leucyl aminopeptidase